MPLTFLVLLGCSPSENERLRRDAQNFTDRYSSQFQRLYYAASLAEWDSNTRIVEGDGSNARKTREAKEALAAFTGSVENIERSRYFLDRQDRLPPLLIRQLKTILYRAADKPQIVADLVRRRIAAETELVERLYGFTYRLEGEEVSTNQLDDILRRETRLPRRLRAWETSKSVGPTLRSGLQSLQRLRNETVRALGYTDFFSYQVSEYGMTTSEILALMKKINRELRPLYREIHTHVRYLLAERYRQPVPDLIPAHWLPNRWGQDWHDLVSVEGLELDGALAQRGAAWLLRQAEDFYVSLGFPPLPERFYERSSLYPLPPGAGYKKNNHASAWHLDLNRDVRSLMSVEPNTNWYETVHHELGHVYYYISYTRPQVPILLRSGANRAFHEGIGSLMGLAALQPRFVSAVGLGSTGSLADPVQILLKEALNYVVFIPWSAGVMTEFEHDLYSRTLDPGQWNRRWWELKELYQGIAPPAPRDEAHCDAATKTHLTDDPAQYYDYALSHLLLFQLHNHIARRILKEDPRNTNYFGRQEVGSFMSTLMRPGATVDWRQLLREATGRDLSADALLDYFEPLMEWLQEQNRNRTHTLPELG